MGEKMKEGISRILFHRDIYSAEAVKLAAYIFADKAEIKLSSAPRGVLAEVAGADKGIAGEFANEALNQQCRLDLGVRNRKLSSMIVTRALLSAAGDTDTRGDKR
jgi:His-Xaa-Ser system protein HxsD